MKIAVSLLINCRTATLINIMVLTIVSQSGAATTAAPGHLSQAAKWLFIPFQCLTHSFGKHKVFNSW
eukprot:3977829-Karenia_brevis.AAC.1